MRGAVNPSSGDIKAGGRPLLGAIEFAKEVDGADRGILDVPASRE
jgi:hypothetical protein